MIDRVGQQLGNYRLLRVLGQGAFATVYLGEHQYLERPAAIKVLHVQMEPEYSTALKRVGIESGLCIVLYLQRTGFPIPKAGEHARSPCSTDNPDEPADICYSARMVASSENATRSSQTRSGDVAVRARPQLRSYGQMGRFDRAQPAQMGQAVRQSWSGRARRLAPSWPHSRFLTRSSPQHS